MPAPTTDPGLEQMIPREVGGHPVSGLFSGLLVETLCTLGGQASIDAARRNLPTGYDIGRVTVGSADVDLGEELITIDAYRMPGGTPA